MNLKEDLKKSLAICNNPTVISDQVYKNLVEICFSELCREADDLNISTLNISKPDVTKELHSALLTLIAEAARNDLKSDSLSGVLVNECGFGQNRTRFLCDLYERRRVKLQIVLGNIGTYLPNLIDVKWRMDYVTKSSDIGVKEGPMFRVSLITEKYNQESDRNIRDTVDFLCTSQELQDLVYKLREAMRHCMKIATER